MLGRLFIAAASGSSASSVYASIVSLMSRWRMMRCATAGGTCDCAMHSTRNLDEVRARAVNVPTRGERTVHIVLAGLKTLATVAAGWRRGAPGGRTDILFLGLLGCVMILSSEVCHLHYFILAMPLITALVATGLDRSRTERLSVWMWALVLVYTVSNALPRLPAFSVTRYLGLAMYAGVALWGFGLVVLWRLTRGTLPERSPAASGPEPTQQARTS